jgi:hypothetical protein
MKKIWLFCLSFALMTLSIVIFCAPNTLGQSQGQEVKPYVVAELPNGSKLYKLVHQGCELFYVAGSVGHTGELMKEWNTPVALTTGRGCR